MTSLRLRVAVSVIAASVTLLALTSCAPAAHSAGGATTTHHHTTKPTPTPAQLVQPASRYPFGCGDLIGASTVATLFSVPMSLVDSARFDRLNLISQIPTSEYVKQLGAIDCTWYDGAKTNDNSHDLELQILPVTPAEWNIFADGGATDIHDGVETECTADEGFNSCGYEAYVNGSRFSLTLNNMKPIPTGEFVLPPAVKAIVAAITASLTSTPLGPVPPAQHPSVALPSSGTAMLTVAQARSALGVGASVPMEVDCAGMTDGPWEIMNEAQKQVDNGSDCEFGLPYNGDAQGPYGLFEFLPAGEWAAKELLADTPTETPVSDSSLPAGDSLYEWTDADGELNGDLILGGNLIEINLFNPSDTGDPAASVPLPTALVNLANDFETTIRD
jgi:hypothetical protein